MSKIKTICRKAVFIFLLAAFQAQSALAFQEPRPQDYRNILEFVRGIAQFLLNAAGVFFVVMFILKGFKLATSASNPRDRVEAINGLLWTAVGAIVTFGAAYLVGITMGIGGELG